MMRNIGLLALLSGLLGGCGQAVECSSQSASAPVTEIVREEVARLAGVKIRENGGPVLSSKIRAAVGQLQIVIDDIRTSKEDPNSTRRFCVGTVGISFDSSALTSADAAREAAELPSIGELASSNDLERNANRFSAEIDFNVQPTDDGKKIFAETESGSNLFDFAAEVVAADLMRASIEQAQRTTRAAAQQATAELAAAQRDSRQAARDIAENEQRLAMQTINAQWRALSKSVRTDLLAGQRAWSRKKDADCRIEGSAYSVEPIEIETQRLTCDARITRERMEWLEQFRTYEAPAPAPATDQGSPSPEEADL